MIRLIWWLLFGWKQQEEEYHECDWSVWSFPAVAKWHESGYEVATQSRACTECGEVEVRWVKAWSLKLADELRRLSPSLSGEVSRPA